MSIIFFLKPSHGSTAAVPPPATTFQAEWLDPLHKRKRKKPKDLQSAIRRAKRIEERINDESLQLKEVIRLQASVGDVLMFVEDIIQREHEEAFALDLQHLKQLLLTYIPILAEKKAQQDKLLQQDRMLKAMLMVI